MQPDPYSHLSDTVEETGSSLKSKWSSLELPVQIGLVVGGLLVFAAVARYVLPAMVAAMGIGLVLVVLFVPYWLPTIIGFFRGHPNKMVIFMMNFFLGWTFVGWWVSLFWALSDPGGSSQPVIVNVTNTATAGGAVVGHGVPHPGAVPPPTQAAPHVAGGTPVHRVGDVVNGHRFDGVNWVPEGVPPQAPPPPPAPSI